MANVLIFADHDGGKVAKTAAELASFAKRGGTPIAALPTDPSQADSLASQLANTDIESVLAVENSSILTFVPCTSVSLRIAQS